MFPRPFASVSQVRVVVCGLVAPRVVRPSARCKAAPPGTLGRAVVVVISCSCLRAGGRVCIGLVLTLGRSANELSFETAYSVRHASVRCAQIHSVIVRKAVVPSAEHGISRIDQCTAAQVRSKCLVSRASLPSVAAAEASLRYCLRLVSRRSDLAGYRSSVVIVNIGCLIYHVSAHQIIQTWLACRPLTESTGRCATPFQYVLLFIFFLLLLLLSLFGPIE